MFKFLKEKLKSAISRISEGVEKEGSIEEKIAEAPKEEPKEDKGFFAKIKDKIIGRGEKEEITLQKIEVEDEKREEKQLENPALKLEKGLEPSSRKKEEKPRFDDKKLKHHEAKEKTKKSGDEGIEIKHETKALSKQENSTEAKAKILDVPQKIEPEKKGFFESIKERIVTTKINEEQFEKLFWELEMALMENNVAVEVIEKIKNDLKSGLVENPIKRTKVEETIASALRDSIGDLFQNNDADLIEQIKNKKEKPYVIAFFGINGSGKTTSIAKVANMLKNNKISCVLAASDTFRAASIEQLQQHADKLGIGMIKHNYGADPAAVAFDAIKHAKAKNINVVLIDTAGRMHSNQNLIDEMKKIIRVAKPDLKIFVGESITGNDCVEQAKTFNESVGIDGIILAKADIDEKGGAAVSVSYVTKKPILFFGTGQKYGDLQPFDSEVIMKNLGLT